MIESAQPQTLSKLKKNMYGDTTFSKTCEMENKKIISEESMWKSTTNNLTSQQVVKEVELIVELIEKA